MFHLVRATRTSLYYLSHRFIFRTCQGVVMNLSIIRNETKTYHFIHIMMRKRDQAYRRRRSLRLDLKYRFPSPQRLHYGNSRYDYWVRNRQNWCPKYKPRALTFELKSANQRPLTPISIDSSTRMKSFSSGSASSGPCRGRCRKW